VILGCTLFGEKLDWGGAAGMILMLAAAGLALRPSQPKAAVPAAVQA
jgi:drug/metabolite transporter (DMT)-like permease